MQHGSCGRSRISGNLNGSILSTGGFLLLRLAVIFLLPCMNMRGCQFSNRSGEAGVSQSEPGYKS